jgi:hypothetical protein
VAFPLWIVGLICSYIAYYIVKRALYLYGVIDEDPPTKIETPQATTTIPAENGSDQTALVADLQRQLKAQQEQQEVMKAMLMKRAQEEQQNINRYGKMTNLLPAHSVIDVNVNANNDVTYE